MEDPAIDATGSTDRRRVEERVRILAAIDQALEDRVTVLQLIGESEGRTQAREALMARFGWDKVESTAVLDLQWAVSRILDRSSGLITPRRSLRCGSR